MAEDTKTDDVDNLPDHVKNNPNWILARVLFQKWGTLHDFHFLQLKRYILVCCNITLGGAFRIDRKNKTIEFYLDTERNFYLKDDVRVKRKKYSPMGYIKVTAKEYKKETKRAKDNLTRWTRGLLWPESDVKVFFDKEVPKDG